MKTSTFEKGIPMLPRLGLYLAVFLGALALFGGCYAEGQEGDRCNPLRSSDECASGLHCSGNPIGISASYPIAFCPENYCCPAMVGPNDSPNCQNGCNGGADAICTAGMDPGACAFATCTAEGGAPGDCPVTEPPEGGSTAPEDAATTPADGGSEGGG